MRLEYFLNQASKATIAAGDMLASSAVLTIKKLFLHSDSVLAVEIVAVPAPGAPGLTYVLNQLCNSRPALDGSGVILYDDNSGLLGL